MTSIGEGSEHSILLQESVIHRIWTPQLGEILLVSQEAGNAHDRHTVALLKAYRTVVGPVLRNVSRGFS